MNRRRDEQITVPPDGQPESHQPGWRRDFPIDWPQDHYVARRDFTKFMVLTSLAFAAGQVWIGFQNVLRRRRGEPPIRRIAALDDIPVGMVLEFNYPGEHQPCLLLRPGEDRLLAYSQRCTHLACSVVPLPDQRTLACPCHQGFFEVDTGRAIAGPPTRPLPRILLELRNGDIYATGVEVTTV